ncbi:UNKNOWN [Stylonychia lemnae]|uniref:Golgin subfamily A member 7/ERF4 domain-containing protein n=1 Tax=Stylonychia lemnae TaxID=5949 RepID=A0A078B6A1_STYLE|nr:UNKNOWN [Stylonychia lemnae]|eukprot:CDW89884.1 UNKNOWN [Stylonychia lemnae]
MGKTFINGLAQQYDPEYDSARLKGYITQADYSHLMDKINEMLFDYFPCLFCQCFGYMCCPISGGLSFLCPMICINDARNNVEKYLQKTNKNQLNSYGLNMNLRFGCSTSWVQLIIIQ